MIPSYEGYYRFAQASQGMFHGEVLPDGSFGTGIFAGGIDVTLGVENSWLKLCYYNNYFCSETTFEKY